jgi:hypothetical protein
MPELSARQADYLERFHATACALRTYDLWWVPERMFSGHARAIIDFGDLRARVFDYGLLSFWDITQDPPPPGRTFGKLDGQSCICFEFGLVEAGEALLKRLNEKAEAAAAALMDDPPPG